MKNQNILMKKINWIKQIDKIIYIIMKLKIRIKIIDIIFSVRVFR